MDVLSLAKRLDFLHFCDSLRYPFCDVLLQFLRLIVLRTINFKYFGALVSILVIRSRGLHPFSGAQRLRELLKYLPVRNGVLRGKEPVLCLRHDLLY